MDAGIRTDVRVEQLDPQPTMEDYVGVILRPKFIHCALFIYFLIQRDNGWLVFLSFL